MSTEIRPVKGKINYKGFNGSIKDVDLAQRIVTGYYAAFGNIDEGMDKLRKGCFAKTISERGPQAANDIFHLKQHNWLHVLGKPNVLREDNYGLYFETKMEDTTEANDVLKLYDAKVYKEHSIGFSYIDFNAVYENEQLKFWDVTEVKLYEGSTVAIAMNRNAVFTGLKSNPLEAIKEMHNELHQCMAILKQGNLTDDTYKCAERRYSQIKEELDTIDTWFKQGPPQAPDTNTEPSESVKSLLAAIEKTKLNLN